MNFKALQKLEFDKVTDRVAGLCGSEWGRKFAFEMRVLSDNDSISQALRETTEARRFIDFYGLIWDFGVLGDLREGLLKLDSGRVLEPSELEGFRSILEFTGKIKGTKIETELFPTIDALREDLFVGTAISRQIQSSIDPDSGTVRDSASDELARTRKKVRELERAIPDNLKRMVSSGEMSSVVQDRIVTIRNGRFVIPVKSDHSGGRQWVLQDRSSSGSTSFVEPLEIVEENNRLTRERLLEKSEVLRILRHLTSLLADNLPEIAASLEALGELDFLQARGRFSREINGIEPIINKGGSIKILKGRHPLLSCDVVPVDMVLGSDLKVLVLTGPNAGGKTVTLKMIGLFHLMAQAGLHVPAGEGTSLPIFSEIFAVIGDEQSIEQNLSTFSSHLTEIKWILDQPSGGGLALIDEICSGTDPEEGTALACSVLKELMARGMVCIATSHQSGLKTFAGVTQGAENARMVFDERQKVPAFSVEIGVPGKSYALEIAAQVGLGKQLISSAKEYLSSQARMTERLLADLEEMKSFIAVERQAIDSEKKEIAKEKEAAKQHLDAAAREREKLLKKALDEAEKIVNETKDRCREIFRTAGTAATLPKKAEVKGEVKKIRKAIESHKEKVVSPRFRPVAPTDLKAGMELLLRDTNQTVKFVSGPDRKGNVKVLLGDFTVLTGLRNLAVSEIPAQKRPLPKRDYSRFVAGAKENAKLEIDLHGMRVVEALEVLERELETLNLAGATQTRVVHGIGTGALMKAVHEYLATSPFVQRFEICELSAGGIGATRVFLK